MCSSAPATIAASAACKLWSTGRRTGVAAAGTGVAAAAPDSGVAAAAMAPTGVTAAAGRSAGGFALLHVV
eukprot:9606426-Prorocentrum_lima.AAC.1